MLYVVVPAQYRLTEMVDDLQFEEKETMT